MIQKIQKVNLFLLWLFMLLLIVLNFETRLSVKSNKTMIEQNRNSTDYEHKSILSKEDTIINLLKKG